jgi:transposase-like protein
MKYEIIKNYEPEKFRRITGLKPETFSKCLGILNKMHAEEHAKNVRKSGRKPKLTMENKLLATLEYLREYRSYAHIAASYNVHESQIVRGVKWIEDTLIKDGTFRLPSRKELLKSDTEYEIVLIDATETPIERPKKNKNNSTQERKKDTQ